MTFRIPPNKRDFFVSVDLKGSDLLKRSDPFKHTIPCQSIKKNFFMGFALLISASIQRFGTA